MTSAQRFGSRKSIAWQGTDAGETYAAGGRADVLRGKGGNDSLTGGGGRDRFVFEATLAKNGVDVIADLEARSACNLGDVLDLSLALGRKVTKRNIGEYVRVAGDQLLVRTGGAGAWET